MTQVQFEDRIEMERHVMAYFGTDNAYAGPIKVRVLCTPSDDGECCSPQDITFEIDGAGDFNFFIDLCNIFEETYESMTYEQIQ
jgi:hypothetical protein